MNFLQTLKQHTYKLLKWSEKWTKTDMIYLARGGFWLTLGQVISSLSAFLLAIAFANFLPKETYGEYKYILSIASILAIPTLTGMGTAVTQAVARGYDGVVMPAMKEKIKWGTLSAVASVGLAGYYWMNGNSTLTFAFLICAVFLPFMDAFELWGPYLNGKRNFKALSKFGYYKKIIYTIFIILVILITKEILLLVAAFFIINTLLNYIILKKSIPSTSTPKGITQILRYGKILSLSNVVSIVAIHIDKIFLFHFFGARELAIYAFALAIPDQIKTVIQNIKPLMLPKFALNTTEELGSSIKQKSVLFLLVTAVIVVLYVSFSKLIYITFFPEYAESIFYSNLYSLTIISAALLYLPITALQSQQQGRTILYYSITISSISIIVMYFGVYFFSLLGLIVAKVITTFLGTFVAFLIFFFDFKKK